MTTTAVCSTVSAVAVRMLPRRTACVNTSVSSVRVLTPPSTAITAKLEKQKTNTSAAAAFRGGSKEDAIAAGSGDVLGSNPRVCNSRHPDAGARHLRPPPVGTHPGVPRRQRRFNERLLGFFGGSISLKPLYMRAY
jgi:hypothetical protein